VPRRPKILLMGGIFLLQILFSSLTHAFCDDVQLKKLPVLSNGRVKPLAVHAAEILKTIIGKRPKGLPATQAYCRLSFHKPYSLSMRIDHIEVKKFLGFSEKQNSFPVEEIQAKDNQITSEFSRLKALGQEKTSYGKEINELLFRLRSYQSIEGETNWAIPIGLNGDESDWVSLMDFRSKYAVGSPEKVMEQIISAGTRYLQEVKTTVSFEYTYYRLNLITFKVFAALLGLILVFLVQRKSEGGVLGREQSLEISPK